MGIKWRYWLIVCSIIVMAFPTNALAQYVDSIYHYFSTYSHHGQKLSPSSVKSYKIFPEQKTIRIDIDGGFAEQVFDEPLVKSIYNTVSSYLPDSLSHYTVEVITQNRKIEYLVPNAFREKDIDKSRTWSISYEGEPWVRNSSAPFTPSKGLDNIHIALWQSHGKYYKAEKADWLWQRPRLFCTTEDLFTQTFVLPYIIPMLENAGAVVYTPRDKNWQNEEVIIDNDLPSTDGLYSELNGKYQWQTSEAKGFAYIKDTYANGNNPFEDGTARLIETVATDNDISTITWTPYIPQAGEYAIYVSYQTFANSTDKALYQVFHKGTITQFEVNQQIGGGTWVYLGTFRFDEGFNNDSKVVLTNKGTNHSVVSADAVRFGCGMGNVIGGRTISHLPRWAEAARYAVQWAGFPEKIYHNFSSNHYNDDLRARSNAVNYLTKGSVFLSGEQGQEMRGGKVPFELTLAFHSDAGFSRNDDIVGSLAVCTTKRAKPIPLPVPQNDGNAMGPLTNDSIAQVDSTQIDQNITVTSDTVPTQNSVTNDSTTVYDGIDRFASYDLASTILNNLSSDLKDYNWPIRPIWNKNYSETREPALPAIILEMLSHQNFADMCLGYDPHFKFDFARSVYKSVLKYIAVTHKKDYVVQPLPVKNFCALLTDKEKKVKLSWQAAEDPTEPSATPQHYILFTRKDGGDFDNGMIVNGTHIEVNITQGIQYSFKVVACNKGGISFPSEILTAYAAPHNEGTILIVNNFTRLEGPAQINTPTEQGFDLDKDPGVQLGLFAGFCGRQKVFSKDHMGSETSNGTGFSGSELEGKIIMGNTFDYPYIHGEAIRTCGGHSFCSTSKDALVSGECKLTDYKYADIICGVQKEYDRKFLTMLNKYAEKGHRLIVSGANIENMLGKEFCPGITAENKGFNPQNQTEVPSEPFNSSRVDYVADPEGVSHYDFYSEMNDKCYSVPSPSILESNQAQTILIYPNQTPAAMYNNKFGRNIIVCGIPLETLKSPSSLNNIMNQFLTLLKGNI